jgi:iron complex transport system substrate-binding protein
MNSICYSICSMQCLRSCKPHKFGVDSLIRFMAAIALTVISTAVPASASQPARTNVSALVAAPAAVSVPVAGKPDVIVIGGALTEIVYALGAEKRLLATDVTAIFPPEAQQLPKVGYQRSLNAEGVLALKPKLILAAAEAGPASALAQIRNAGVRVESFTAEHTPNQIITNAKRVADALGLSKEGEALTARLSAQLAEMQRVVQTLPGKPRVVFLLAHGNAPQVSGEGTAADAMIGLAGAENAMRGFRGYRPLSAEGMIAAAPDVILMSTQGIEAAGGIDQLLKQPGLILTPAGRSRRVVEMDQLLLLGFGPRLPQAVGSLAQALRVR